MNLVMFVVCKLEVGTMWEEASLTPQEMKGALKCQTLGAAVHVIVLVC